MPEMQQHTKTAQIVQQLSFVCNLHAPMQEVASTWGSLWVNLLTQMTQLLIVEKLLQNSSTCV